MNGRVSHENRVIEEFIRITAIPRPSGGEAEIGNYVIGVADEMGYRWRRDGAGNIAIFLPPSTGMEETPGLIVQAHLDMVCVSESPRDFKRKPPEVVEDDGWITARGTTLGADNGVGVALCVLVAQDRELRHGPLSLLFTVEEETGIRGMSALSPELLDPRAAYAINIDFESESHICVGCAGGLIVRAEADLRTEETPAGESVLWTVRARGIQGGHSGLDIGNRPGNIHRRLLGVAMALDARPVTYIGGDAINSIPSWADMTFTTPRRDLTRTREILAEEAERFAREYAWEGRTPALEFKPSEPRTPIRRLSRDSWETLAKVVTGLPDGVVSRDPVLGGVRSSSSTGLLSLTEPGRLSLGVTARSDDPDEAGSLKERILRLVACLPGAKTAIDEFPPWETGS
jgi:dipeptidase D